MFNPASVEPRLKNEQTRLVWDNACGRAFIRFSSEAVSPFWTYPPKPPMKSIFAFPAARSSVLATLTAVAIVRGSGSSNSETGCDRDAAVDDGHAVFLFHDIGGGVELLAHFDNPLFDAPAEMIGVTVHTVFQIDAQRDSANIKILMQRHINGFKYFLDGYGHCLSPQNTVCI